MIETRLGEFEEVLLLLVGILGTEAYAFNIAMEFEDQTGRSVSIGATHSTLKRLEDKGFLKSAMGDPSQVRGGRRKRMFEITAFGIKALEQSRDLRTSLWNRFPGFSNGFVYG